MKYSFVFVGERDEKQTVNNLISKINLPHAAIQVIFLTTKNNVETFENCPVRVRTIVFKQTASSKQMFETLVQNESLGTVVLFKEGVEVKDFSDVQRMIGLCQGGEKLVVSNRIKQENVFLKALNKIKSFFVKLCLGVKTFRGEADVILLDNVLVETLSQLEGKSAYLTSVNGWAGVEEKNVTVDVEQKQKSKLPLRNLTYPLICAGILLLMIVGNILFSVLNVSLPFLAIFAYIAVEVAIFCFFIYLLTKMLFFAKYGNIAYTLKSDVLFTYDNFNEN